VSEVTNEVEKYREIRVYQSRGICDANGKPLSPLALAALHSLAEAQQQAAEARQSWNSAMCWLK
jgi:hypothetical protein